MDPIMLNDWHVVACSKDVGLGQIVSASLLGQDLVLWRHPEQIVAWDNRCSHRGAKLSQGRIEDDCLVCPYHGARFASDGSCVHVPAHPNLTFQAPKSRIRTFQAQEKYGFIWVCLGDPQWSLPELPERGDPSFGTFLCGPYHIHASPARVVENFCDAGHLPFVHAGSLGDPSAAEVAPYDVEVTETSITLKNQRCIQTDPDGTGERKEITYWVQIHRPFLVYSRKESDTTCFSTLLCITPLGETECIAWYNIARNFDLETADEQFQAFQNQLMAEDIPILEGQTPKRLPLDLEAEFHFPMDKLSISYRKWLKQQGLKLGVY
ncbi:MAG: aromatic ring-hydroxylating dioxygenase subunit alpha [Synechococcales cyanobacterium]